MKKYPEKSSKVSDNSRAVDRCRCRPSTRPTITIIFIGRSRSAEVRLSQLRAIIAHLTQSERLVWNENEGDKKNTEIAAANRKELSTARLPSLSSI